MSTATLDQGLQAKPATRRTVIRRSLFVLVLSGLAVGLWLGWRTLRNRPDETLGVAFREPTGVRTITIETFLPKQAQQSGERVPAVVLLHGVEGAKRYAAIHHATARGLADQGYAVFFVHYFDAVDYADLWYLQANGDLDTDEIERWITRDKRQWISAVSTVLGQLAKRPEVDAERISLLGYSLGSFISYSVGQEALADPALPDIACVVGNWGAKFSDLIFTPGYPETLLIHGGADKVVETRYAQQTADELQAVGTSAKLIIVPTAGHLAYTDETWKETLGFLRQKFDAIANRRTALYPRHEFQLSFVPADNRWPRFP